MSTRWLGVLLLVGTVSCQGSSSDQPSENVSSEKSSLLEQYPMVPDGHAILREGEALGDSVFSSLLEKRYEQALSALKAETDANGAKLIVTLLSPEMGNSATAATRPGSEFIIEISHKLGLENHNLIDPLLAYEDQKITQMPLDGHWSELGSGVLADLYKPILESNSAHRSTKVFSETERPDLFGDLDADQNVALDGGKNLPYQLVTNAQGLRMDFDLKFPKATQRVLFLGDSQLYSPFLDNNQIFTSKLQAMFPQMEIINAGVIGYTLDDYVSLYSERAKYTEADIVILVTNPNDISDFFFTQRNKMSRSKSPANPEPLEIELYKKLFQ